MLDKIISFFRRFSLTKVAYNVFVNNITKQVVSIQLSDDVIESYVILKKNKKDAEAYLIKNYQDNRKTQTRLDQSIDIELLPDEYKSQICNNGMCRMNINY